MESIQQLVAHHGGLEVPGRVPWNGNRALPGIQDMGGRLAVLDTVEWACGIHFQSDLEMVSGGRIEQRSEGERC